MYFFGLQVLHNITDYLIEEASAEEEELLGASATEGEDAADVAGGGGLTRDDELVPFISYKISLPVFRNLYCSVIHHN